MPFIVSRAGAEGLTYEQTRRRSMTTPTRAFVISQTDTWKDQVRALALVLPPGAVFSHDTAAQLHKLPLPTLDGTPLDVTVASRPRGDLGTRCVGTTQTPLRTAHPGGLPATDLARTWLDLGSRLTPSGRWRSLTSSSNGFPPLNCTSRDIDAGHRLGLR